MRRLILIGTVTHLLICSPALCAPAKKSLATLESTPAMAGQSAAHQINGIWYGKIRAGDVEMDATLEVNTTSGEISATLTCRSPVGVSKHYMRGHFSAAQDQLVASDIGVDKAEGASDWFPAAIDHYTLNFVEGGKKLAGSCHQSNNQDTLWINLSRAQQANPKDSAKLVTQPEHNDTHAAARPLTDPNAATPDGNHLLSDTTKPQIGVPRLARIKPDCCPFRSKVENNAALDGGSTQAINDYLHHIDDVRENHWVRPQTQQVPSKGMRYIHFTVDREGNISNLRLDTPSVSDGYLDAYLNAIKASGPYLKPPQEVLNELKADHVDVCSPCGNPDDDVSAELASFGGYLQKQFKGKWHSPRGVRGRDITLYFRIYRDGRIGNLRLDPASGDADEWAVAAMNAVQSSSPIMPPPERLFFGDDHLFITFTFRSTGPNSVSRNILPLLPLMLLGRGVFIYNH